MEKEKSFYVGIETEEGGVRESVALPEVFSAYLSKLLDRYPGGSLFLREN